jgi:hypothetical protein
MDAKWPRFQDPDPAGGRPVTVWRRSSGALTLSVAMNRFPPSSPSFWYRTWYRSGRTSAHLRRRERRQKRRCQAECSEFGRPSKRFRSAKPRWLGSTPGRSVQRTSLQVAVLVLPRERGLKGVRQTLAYCPCVPPANDERSGSTRKPRLSRAFAEPTPGLEPGTPSLRVNNRRVTPVRFGDAASYLSCWHAPLPAQLATRATTLITDERVKSVSRPFWPARDMTLCPVRRRDRAAPMSAVRVTRFVRSPR